MISESRVSSEQNVSQKNGKIFVRISHVFAKMNEAKNCKNDTKFCENFTNIFAKKNSAKTKSM